MRRYAETFYRYWFIALFPIIALPAADCLMIRHTPRAVIARLDDRPPRGVVFNGPRSSLLQLVARPSR